MGRESLRLGPQEEVERRFAGPMVPMVSEEWAGMSPNGRGARVLLPDLFSQDGAFTVWMQSESGLRRALNW